MHIYSLQLISSVEKSLNLTIQYFIHQFRNLFLMIWSFPKYLLNNYPKLVWYLLNWEDYSIKLETILVGLPLIRQKLIFKIFQTNPDWFINVVLDRLSSTKNTYKEKALPEFRYGVKIVWMNWLMMKTTMKLSIF